MFVIPLTTIALLSHSGILITISTFLNFTMSAEILFQMNSGLYKANPQFTDLGQKIIKHSILMLDSIGLEQFTFKKLANKIESTEASIYRYFESKHQLLIYLVSWYWEWLSYLITTDLKNIEDPKQKLKIIIHNIAYATEENPSVEFVNESVLHRVLVSEGTKAYHTKAIDDENKEGMFGSYKDLVTKVADVVSEVNSSFKYPRSLASNLVEMSNNQAFFAMHLPSLTDISAEKSNDKKIETMLEYFAFKLLK